LPWNNRYLNTTIVLRLTKLYIEDNDYDIEFLKNYNVSKGSVGRGDGYSVAPQYATLEVEIINLSLQFMMAMRQCT
jgi:hypothetical protein